MNYTEEQQMISLLTANMKSRLLLPSAFKTRHKIQSSFHDRKQTKASSEGDDDGHTCAAQCNTHAEPCEDISLT